MYAVTRTSQGRHAGPPRRTLGPLLVIVLIAVPMVSGCLTGPLWDPQDPAEPGSTGPAGNESPANSTIRIPAPRIGTKVDYGNVEYLVTAVEGSGADRVLTVAEEWSNESATFTFRPGTGLPLERVEPDNEHLTRYHAEYRSLEGWLVTIARGAPWPPFFLWNRSLPLDEPVEIDLFEGKIRVVAEPAEALRGRITSRSTEALAALGDDLSNRTAITVRPELPTREDRGPALLVFQDGHAFPEVVATGEGEPTRVDRYRTGDEVVPWTWRPQRGYDWSCAGETAAFHRYPPDGDASEMPFPFAEALAEARNTSSWQEYVEEHPDAYIAHARFRDLTQVETTVDDQPPRYEWVLLLVHPNNDGDAWARVFEVTKPPHPDAVAAVTSEGQTPIGPEPSPPSGGVQVTTFGWLWREFTDRFPDQRVDLSWWLGDVNSTHYAGETRAIVHNGGDEPLVDAYGGRGCFLERFRLPL